MVEGRPDKLSIVVFSGDFDKVHYALVLAAGAAAIDTPVTLFFTMEACRALDRENGWRNLPVSWAEGPETGAAMDQGFADRNVATFEGLLESCAALGVRFLVCEMGLKAIGLDREVLRTDIEIEIGGVVTFLNDASKDGGLLFV